MEHGNRSPSTAVAPTSPRAGLSSASILAAAGVKKQIFRSSRRHTTACLSQDNWRSTKVFEPDVYIIVIQKYRVRSIKPLAT